MRENLPRPVAAPRPSPAGPAQPVKRKKRGPFSFLSRLSPRFATDVFVELRKVTWPTFADTRYLTLVVAIVAVIMGVLLGLTDLLFGWIIDRLFF